MTTLELVELFRDRADDETEPYLWGDNSVKSYFDLAEEEACRRKNLLFDSTDESVCKIDIVSDTSTYSLHSSIVDIKYAYLLESGNTTELSIISRGDLSQIYPSWRTSEGEPKYLIIDEMSVQVVPTPQESYSLWIEVFRLPIEKLSATGTPSISSIHHRFLLYWALHLAFSKRDVDTFNDKKALDYKALFDDYFEPRSTSDKAKRTYVNRPQRNRVW